MRIAYDLRRIVNPGIGRYMKCLVEAILARRTNHQYILIMPPTNEVAIDIRGAEVESVTSAAKYYSLREQVELPGILRRHGVDLLHSPHFLLPLIPPCPAIVTIHDVIYLACKTDLPSRIGRLYYYAMMAAAVRVAKRVITDSEFSKQDIVRYLGTDPSKIEVIYPSVSRDFLRIDDSAAIHSVRDKYGIEREYVLYAGIYKPRKNHTGLFRAFQKFIAYGGDADLVIAGPMKDGKLSLLRIAEKLCIADRVKFTGFVSDDDLKALYSGARLYACPSLYEGFGFTVLEAMACGTPVVCSAKTSLGEVGGDAAVYADACNPEEFGHALYRVFTDTHLRETLVTRGPENLKRFSWDRAATQTLAAYQHAYQ